MFTVIAVQQYYFTSQM